MQSLDGKNIYSKSINIQTNYIPIYTLNKIRFMYIGAMYKIFILFCKHTQIASTRYV